MFMFQINSLECSCINLNSLGIDVIYKYLSNIISNRHINNWTIFLVAYFPFICIIYRFLHSVCLSSNQSLKSSSSSSSTWVDDFFIVSETFTFCGIQSSGVGMISGSTMSAGAYSKWVHSPFAISFLTRESTIGGLAKPRTIKIMTR